MTEIVFKPEPGAKIVAGRGLYRAHQNRKPLDLLFRARNAGEADAMLQYLFENQTAGKIIDYDLKGMLNARRRRMKTEKMKKATVTPSLKISAK